MYYQCLITPAIITKLVIMYINTIAVLIIAIRSDSALVDPDLSPKLFAHKRHSLFDILLNFGKFSINNAVLTC